MHVSLISDEKVEDLTQGKDYTVNDRQVTLAAPTGLKIKIYRVTTTKPLVGWADASVLRAADMTVQSTQLLHLAEETSDLAQDGGLSKDTADNVWDARFNKIKNLLDPTDPGDAVTLSYITKNQSSLLTQLQNTGAAQNASIVATGDAQNARLVHTGNTQNARLNSTGDTQNARLNDTGDLQNTRLTTTGNNYVSTMTSLKNTATDKATEATNQAAIAKKWAVSETSPDGGSASKSSKTWAGEAKASASNAASSASASASSATASQNSASSSASSASTATQKATEAASSATAAATSASNAATSATNAKASETKAASSASAAAQSADRAATFDPSHYPLKEYYIDLSHLDENTFYPVVFDERNKRVEADILSKSGIVPYGQDVLSLSAYCNGTGDGSHHITIKNYFISNTSKIAIGCLAAGRTHGGVCVWLRGGPPSPYTIISTIKPILYENGWTKYGGNKYEQIATVGTTYHGAETGNVNLDIILNPLDLPNDSAKNLEYTTYGTFEKAIKDADGRVIHDTYATKNDVYTKAEVTAALEANIPTKTSQLTNDSGFAVIRNGHLVINGSELWIE